MSRAYSIVPRAFLEPAAPAGWYASPTGQASNAGTFGSPWDLATALSKASTIQPGDTLYLRGGTYGTGTQNFVAVLNGSSVNPVKIQQFPGERVRINCATFSLQGSYTWFISTEWAGIELYCGVTSPGNTTGLVMEFGNDGNRAINLIIHDFGANGVNCQSANKDHELYGCLIYNNGRDTPDPFAHGIYGHGTTTVGQTRRIFDNDVINNVGYGIHMYSSDVGNLSNIDIEGNYTFGNGVGNGMEMLIGGSTPLINLLCKYNWSVIRNDPGATCARFGYGNDIVINQSGIIEFNYLAGLTRIDNWDGANLTFRNNTLVGAFYQLIEMRFVGTSLPDTSGFDFNNQSYAHNVANGTNEFVRDLGGATTGYTFAGWKTATSFDSLSTMAGTDTLGTQVSVRLNSYNNKLARVRIHNPSGASTVNVDPSALLSPGDTYSVYNIYDPFGPAVLSGTYVGSPLAFPMTGVSPRAFIGGAFTASNKLPYIAGFALVKG